MPKHRRMEAIAVPASEDDVRPLYCMGAGRMLQVASAMLLKTDRKALLTFSKCFLPIPVDATEGEFTCELVLSFGDEIWDKTIKELYNRLRTKCTIRYPFLNPVDIPIRLSQEFHKPIDKAYQPIDNVTQATLVAKSKWFDPMAISKVSVVQVADGTGVSAGNFPISNLTTKHLSDMLNEASRFISSGERGRKTLDAEGDMKFEASKKRKDEWWTNYKEEQAKINTKRKKELGRGQKLQLLQEAVEKKEADRKKKEEQKLQEKEQKREEMEKVKQRAAKEREEEKKEEEGEKRENEEACKRAKAEAKIKKLEEEEIKKKQKLKREEEELREIIERRDEARRELLKYQQSQGKCLDNSEYEKYELERRKKAEEKPTPKKRVKNTRTPEEQKQYLKEYHKRYRAKNRERLIEYDRLWRLATGTTKADIGEETPIEMKASDPEKYKAREKQRKKRAAEYREENREKLRKLAKEYRVKNRDLVNSKQRKKMRRIKSDPVKDAQYKAVAKKRLEEKIEKLKEDPEKYEEYRQQRKESQKRSYLKMIADPEKRKRHKANKRRHGQKHYKIHREKIREQKKAKLEKMKIENPEEFERLRKAAVARSKKYYCANSKQISQKNAERKQKKREEEKNDCK